MNCICRMDCVLLFVAGKMPSVLKLQKLLEAAWSEGFDQMGCAQLNGKVVKTQKWIGATEIVALLSSLHVK
jgi:hypothetical protein